MSMVAVLMLVGVSWTVADAQGGVSHREGPGPVPGSTYTETCEPDGLTCYGGITWTPSPEETAAIANHQAALVEDCLARGLALPSPEFTACMGESGGTLPRFPAVENWEPPR